MCYPLIGANIVELYSFGLWLLAPLFVWSTWLSGLYAFAHDLHVSHWDEIADGIDMFFLALQHKQRETDNYLPNTTSLYS